MAQAAYVKKLQVSEDGKKDWKEVPVTTCSLELGGDVLDDTSLADSAGYRSRILGLHDFSITGDANYDTSDGLKLIRAAKVGRTELHAQYLPDGKKGFQGQIVVESFNMSGELGGLETVSFTLQGDGALKAV